MRAPRTGSGLVRRVKRPAIVGGTILGIALLGVAASLITRAAGPVVSLEPEKGTLAAPAILQPDTTASGSSAIRFTATVARQCQVIAVPSYFYPSGTNLWTSATRVSSIKIMLLNPSSGPGTVRDTNYVAAVAAARTAGQTVFGYVASGYTVRPAATVKAEIDRYQTLYNVTDIFIDEASATAAQVAYYTDLTSYVHRTAGARTILNPGTPPVEAYMNAGDIIITAENNYANYMAGGMPAWTAAYPPQRFMHLIYRVPDATAMTQVLTKSRQDRAGYIYITDDDLPNPWDTLPPYITAESTQAAAGC